MDKTAIKNYAVKVRRDLISAVKQKWEYIEQDGESNLFLSSKGRETLTSLSKKIEAEGIDNVMENIAYTWFNRLIALRYMEINDYLPSGIRILSSVDKGRIEPDALRQVSSLDFVNPAKVAEIKADTALNADEKLYRYILIAQCNDLSKILPSMFQKLDDYTELLLPDSLYSTGGIVHELVNAIHEDNFSIEKQGQIEIIGWLYQYYTSEKKDEVFAALKKNVKITKETIPAATQLFTPEWIVKYMVENSLGRLWLERHPNEDLRKSWLYYVDEAEQEPQVAEQLKAIREASPINKPEDIRFIDPCMGSGHILVYAFDVLFQIYKSEGHTDRDIPNLILTHNLHGLDIDDRAGQLAYFALMMKARAYNRRFFRQDTVPQPMVYSANNDPEISEFGSLIKIDGIGEKPEMPKEYTLDNIDEVANHDRNLLWWNYRRLLAQKYDVVVTNPPYLAPTPKQADWVKKNYPNSKSDLCVVFIERNFELLKTHGLVSMITMHSWMFLSSYEKFRGSLIATKDIVNMVHLGARAFEEIGGEVVQTTAFVLGKTNTLDYLATYARLVDFAGQQVKEEAFLRGEHRYNASKLNFEKIPSVPIAYWVSEKALYPFTKNIFIKDVASPRAGLATGDNTIYQRFWYEIDNKKIGFNYTDTSETLNGKHKWFPCNSGGEFRKWSINNELIVNWEYDGKELRELRNAEGKLAARPQNTQFYFKKGLTWNKLSSSRFAVKYKDVGSIYDDTSRSAFPLDEVELFYIIGFLCSTVCFNYLRAMNPTMSFTNNDLERLPYIFDESYLCKVDTLVLENIEHSRNDWDTFETSWDFQRHPFLTGYGLNPMTKEVLTIPGIENLGTLEWQYDMWRRLCENRFNQLKANEEELNRIFIDIYGLQDELTPEVAEKDVTVRKADLGRDVRSFISYAVGCMFGRYSLDEPGLVFAGAGTSGAGTFDPTRYKTFKPVSDNIIPINHIDYFDTDIVLMFVEFVRAVYGDNALGENLDFIANALYPDANGTARERIRRYFLNDFYKDHLKIYQKRPIYWQMESGGSSGGSKKDGFKALFYLHRYDKYTMARARTDYLHPLQRKYDAEIKDLTQSIADDLGRIGEQDAERPTSPSKKAAANKAITMLQGKIDECRAYDPVVAHIAYREIDLDLDDGVKVNYAKFQGVEVPKDDGTSAVMDLLGRV